MNFWATGFLIGGAVVVVVAVLLLAILWVGGSERPVFIEQAKQLAKAWSCDLWVDQPTHHFDVIDDLRDPTSSMVRRLTPE